MIMHYTPIQNFPESSSIAMLEAVSTCLESSADGTPPSVGCPDGC